MASLPTQQSPSLAAGILSVGQGAEALAVKPIAVRRLIAIGELLDNRNARGPVVMADDLERFIGRGSPRLEMPEIAPNGWFRDLPVARPRFLAAMKERADGLREIPDAMVEAAFRRDFRARVYRFAVPPTVEMRELYRSDTGRLFGAGTDGPGITYGVMAIVSELRSQMRYRIGRTSNRNPLASDLERLYESPEAFRGLVERSVELATNALRVEVRETRGVSDRTRVTVVREVTLESLASSLTQDIERAIAIAF